MSALGANSNRYSFQPAVRGTSASKTGREAGVTVSSIRTENALSAIRVPLALKESVYFCPAVRPIPRCITCTGLVSGAASAGAIAVQSIFSALALFAPSSIVHVAVTRPLESSVLSHPAGKLWTICSREPFTKSSSPSAAQERMQAKNPRINAPALRRLRKRHPARAAGMSPIIPRKSAGACRFRGRSTRLGLKARRGPAPPRCRDQPSID